MTHLTREDFSHINDAQRMLQSRDPFRIAPSTVRGLLSTIQRLDSELAVSDAPTPDSRPHSRACGWAQHDHGTECSTNCPTCGGRMGGI